MLILANALIGLSVVLNSLLGLLMFLIIARVIISWVNADPYNVLVRIIVSSTDPILVPMRRKMPLNMGGLDFSPIVVILVIYALQYVVAQSLNDYGQVLRATVLRAAAGGI
jgi:YggT family protein